MVATRKLEIQVTGDADSAGRMFSKVRGEADDTESRFSKWGKAVAGAVGVAFATDVIFEWGSALIGAAEEAQKVTRQTEAVIASMGDVAGVTAEEVADLAEAISLKTGLDDEMIQSGENVLLTFGNVRNEVGDMNDVFNRAVEVATDMSVALGQDLQSSVTQVGKALNDPVAGLSALSRVGVQFTDDQKAMIETLVASGDALGAQKVILEELERQFGGSAEAQATASGKLQVAWDNLVETLGTALLPHFEQVANWLSINLPLAIAAAQHWLAEHKSEIQDVVEMIKTWVEWIGRAAEFIGFLIRQIRDAVEWLHRLADRIASMPVIGNIVEGGGLASKGNLPLGSKGGKPIPKFDSGGTLAPGINVVNNATGRPEPLVPPRLGGDTYITVNVDGSVLTSGRDLISLINDAVASGYRLQAQGRGL